MSAVYAMTDLTVDLPRPRALPFGRAARPINILDGITLSVDRAETLGLVGESGSGKTTLARAMLGLIPVSGGTRVFDGGTLDPGAGLAALRRGSAMMFQDPVGSLSPRMRVGRLVTEPFAIHGPALPDRRARAVALLEEVGLPASLVSRYPHELSGGQARRVAVARALALGPKLVVADEPTAGLDVSVQGEILNLMSRLRDEKGIAFLVISHNLAMLRHVSDRIAILYLGRLVETGPTAEVFARPRHPYTASLIAAEPKPDPRKRRADLAIRGEIPSLLQRPQGCGFHTRCPLARDRCRTDPPALAADGAGREVRCHYPLAA